MNSHSSKRNLEINEEKYNGDDTSSSSSFCISINEESANSEQAVGYSLHSSNSQSRKISKKKRDGNLYDFLFNQSNDDEDSHLLELVASHNKTKNYISDKPDEIQEHILDYLDIVSAINLSFCSKSYYRLFINYVDNEKIAKNIIELCVASQKIEFFSSLLPLITETIKNAVDNTNNRWIKKSLLPKMGIVAMGSLPGSVVTGLGSRIQHNLAILYDNASALVSSLATQTNHIFNTIRSLCPALDWEGMDKHCGKTRSGFRSCGQLDFYKCSNDTKLICEQQYVPSCSSLFDAIQKREYLNSSDIGNVIDTGIVILIAGFLSGAVVIYHNNEKINRSFSATEIDFLKKEFKKIIPPDKMSKDLLHFLEKNDLIKSKASALKVKELLEKQLKLVEKRIESVYKKLPAFFRQRPRNHLSNVTIHSLFKSSPKKMPKDHFQLLLNNSNAEEPVVPRFLFQ